MIVYGSSLSPFVRKVLAFAAEKGIEVELKPIGARQQGSGIPRGEPVRQDAGLSRRRFRDLRFHRDRRLSGRGEARAEPDPDRAEGAGADDLVRRIRRHDPVRLRRQDVLQPDRRAALPEREGDVAAADKAECEELPPLLDYLERVIPRKRLAGRGPADAGRHCRRQPVRQFAGISASRSTRTAIRRSRAMSADALARPSFAPGSSAKRRSWRRPRPEPAVVAESGLRALVQGVWGLAPFCLKSRKMSLALAW